VPFNSVGRLLKVLTTLAVRKRGGLLYTTLPNSATANLLGLTEESTDCSLTQLHKNYIVKQTHWNSIHKTCALYSWQFWLISVLQQSRHNSSVMFLPHDDSGATLYNVCHRKKISLSLTLTSSRPVTYRLLYSFIGTAVSLRAIPFPRLWKLSWYGRELRLQLLPCAVSLRSSGS